MIDHCSLYWKKFGGGGIYVLYFVEAPIFFYWWWIYLLIIHLYLVPMGLCPLYKLTNY